MAGLSYFPELAERRLFLASPGDVGYLRRMAQQLVEDMEGAGGGADSLAMFAWESEFADTAFNDVAPIQEQIYRPDDPFCRGVVAFFGEKIGQPLADDFPTDMLHDLMAMKGDVRLVHPWRPEAADEGGFPLTGSTFEVLCAFSANRRRHAESAGEELPVFLRFVGPPDCLAIEDPGRANWGNRELRNLIKQEFADDDEEEFRHRRMVREQLKCLRNFVLFLKKLGIEPRFETDAERIAADLRNWLRERFLLTVSPTDVNPFLGLRSYDVGDYRVYFGRGEAQKAAIETIDSIFRKAALRNFYWIEGSSGAGKSSFLRAGVVGGLQQSSRARAEYAQIVVRPNDLLSKAAAAARSAHCPLRVLFEKALDALLALPSGGGLTRSAIDRALADFDACAEQERGAWAADFLDRQLDKVNAERDAARPCRLLVGIDQFEEIVDMLEDEELAPKWQLFMDFVDRASRCRHVFIIATMREERVEKMKRDRRLGDLESESRQQRTRLGFPSDQELEAIIRRPFNDFGRAHLDDALVAHIIEVVRDYTRRHTIEEVGGVLPLISLMLLRINENVAAPLVEKRFEAADKEPSLEGFDEAAADRSAKPVSTGIVTLTLEDAREYTQIEGVIADLAQKAMDTAREQKALEAGETTVDNLLRQLVRWSGSDDKQFSLPTIALPTDSSERALALALLRHRLLVNEGGGQVRLVHETVLQHWPEARSFIQRERPLHENARELVTLAKIWARSEKSKTILDAGLEEHAEAAFQILSFWSARFHPLWCKTPDPADVMLRDYCLALLDAKCDPAQVVDTPKRPTHMHLATFYGCRDIVTRMIERAGERASEYLNARSKDGRTPLTSVAFSEDVDLLTLLLENGADPNTREDAGWQPIHAAAVGGSVGIARCLHAHGGKVDLDASPDRVHPIHLAAQHGHKPLVTYFIDEMGVDVDIPDASGQTPVMRAILNDEADMIRHLVSKGANLALTIDALDNPTSVAMNSLHVAARAGAVRSIETLIDLGMSADQPMRNQWTALHLAAHNNFPASVRVLADHMSDIDVRTIRRFGMKENASVQEAIDSGKSNEDAGWSALHIAALEGHVKVIRALHEKGADIAATTNEAETPLHVAVRKDRDEAAIFLSGLADTFGMRDKRGRTPLQLAVFRKRLALASDLMRQGARIDQPVHDSGMRDEDRVTLLHTAAVSRDETLMGFVLGHDREIGRKTARGRSALHLAAGNGRERTLRRLLSQWTDGLYDKDEEGLTPFDAACLSGSLECVEQIAAKAQDTVLRQQCPLAVHHAAQSGNARIVQKLVDRGFDPQTYDQDGRTPLHIAAQDGHANVVKELLQNGARSHRPLSDDPNVSAFELAAECGHTEVLKILLDQKEAAAVDLDALTFRALELMQFDCVAVLLRHLGVRDLKHPATGVAVSALYGALLAEMNERLPDAAAGSAELDQLVAPEPAPSVAPKADRTSVPSVKPNGQNKARPNGSAQAESKGGNSLGQVTTQSRRHGLGGDIYPEFERRPRHMWHVMTAEELAKFIERISPVDGKHQLNGETGRGFYRHLPWYDDVQLINLADSSLENPKIRFCYLVHAGNLYRLNGTSPPIHEVNAKAPIRLNQDNAADYLRFFMFFVRGEEGPFYVCEDEADPLIPGAGNAALKNIVKSTARPISLNGVNEKNHILCDAVVYYSNAIFIASLAIHPTGMIEMVDDEPIAADLPSKIDAPLA